MSTMRVTNLKHENSASNNIVLNSDGSVGGDLATTLGSKPAATYGTVEPSSPATGDIWYDSNDDPATPKFYDGTEFVNFPSGAGDAVISSPAATGQYTDTGVTYDYYTFTASGTLTVDTAGFADLLVIGGGAGGGLAGQGGGGGGAGGHLYVTDAYLPAGTATVTVGAGGAASFETGTRTPHANNGQASRIASYFSPGGGGGGSGETGSGSTSEGSGPGLNGGSGGGSGSGFVSTAASGGAGISDLGNNGGDGNIGGGGTRAGGGGGGASAAGGNASSGTAGAGGNGTANSITGSSVTRAGGGGGGGTTAGSGGTGGGGAGGGNGVVGTAGSANTGGGGGGAWVNSGSAGAGGSGVVIVRVKV